VPRVANDAGGIVDPRGPCPTPWRPETESAANLVWSPVSPVCHRSSERPCRSAQPTGAVNDAERLLFDALDGLGLEGCCGEPSHGGPSATTGAIYDGARLPIGGTPTDVWLERAEALIGPQPQPLGSGEATLHRGDNEIDRMLSFHCGEFTWTIGWWEDEPAEVDSMLLLAEALLPRLACTLRAAP
jgi:hypothetical protein